MTILFNTNLRKKLMGYLFAHTGEELYVRQLAYAIGLDPGNVSRELRQLEGEGLVISSHKGSLKLYRLDPAYPLFNELKQIVFKTEGVVASLKALVHSFPQISLAYIYGSFAKDQENSKSDIDLLIVGENLSTRDITKKVRDLENALNREINFTPYSPQEYKQRVAKKGGFLHLVHRGPKILLKDTTHE
jgi:DNA-binding transcriptional ArsR family regulator